PRRSPRGGCQVAPATRLALRRSERGQRTDVAQPSFSKAQMTRALESIWPRRTPWRAHVGSAWCRLCHDSPIDSAASHQTLPERSRLAKGRSPIAWQIELIDQVTWWSNPTRTSDAQKNAVAAPTHDDVSRPPTSAGASSETATSRGKARDTRLMSLSLSR